MPTPAAEYPDRPIRFIVPSAAGGGPDIHARLISTELTKQMGQQIVVDNRAGAAGSIGAEMIARAAPDGYTIGYGTISMLAINPSFLAKLPYDPGKDLQMVVQLVFTPSLLAVTPTFPIKSVKELIDYARNNPGKLSYGSAGSGSILHLGMELFKLRTGTQIVHVPYKGAGQAVTSVMGGEIPLMFPNIPLALPFIQTGRLKGVAVSTAKRLSWWPDMPTIGETVKGFEVRPWFSVMGPKNLPEQLVKRLHHELMKVMSAPDVRDNLIKQGFEIQTSSPQELRVFAKSERTKWARVVKASGAQVD
jgi:tripartite-type tricarboxylate transporter receptor subunit TctC